MEEVAENITQDEVLELIGEFPVQPLRNTMIISVNTDDEDDLDLEAVGFAETQFVISKGSHVHDTVKAGGRVLLDLEKLSTQIRQDDGEVTFSLKIKPIKVGDRVFGIVNDTCVLAIDNR